MTFFFCLFLFWGSLSVPAAGAETALKEEEQRRRALEIRLELSRLSEERAQERESLYYEIVKSCPETEAAEEALWGLSNLYLDAYPEPREQAAQEVLELFLAHYPNSKWGIQVRSRLILLYSGTNKRRRAAELCRELLEQKKMELPNFCRPFFALTEAVVWDEEKEMKKAKEAYTLLVRDYPRTSYALLAAKRLTAMAVEEKKAKPK